MLDFLLARSRARGLRLEPRLDVAAVLAAAQSVAPPPAPAPPPDPRRRLMSPRQMAAWAHEMYLAGWMSWEDYRAAIPAELHPNYDATVAILTGEAAAPDRPRDMVLEWQERLEYVRRYHPASADPVKRAERIFNLVRWQAEQAPEPMRP